MYDSRGWPPRSTVAAQRQKAERERAKLAKQGRALLPIVIHGRKIATTFWGTAWCNNLESYSDFANRLPRGRSYVRNGLVLHLEITGGTITALVRGSALYKVSVTIASVPKAHWTAICADSAGAIDSLVELLQGRFPTAVMQRISRQRDGLFPTPGETKFSCSCPDVASMCKHVCAVLYGVGARLDDQPELIFRLRSVDEKDLISAAGGGARLTARTPSRDKLLADANLSELFGLQLAERDQQLAPKHATGEKLAAGKRARVATAIPARAAATTPTPPTAKPTSKPTAKPKPTQRPK